MKFLVALTALCGSATALPALEEHYAQIAKRGVNGLFLPTTAPRENIFRDISEHESEQILEFLEKQQNGNGTIPDDMSFDFYWQRPFLLQPNKTEATAYLDGDGKKPKRYARVMGEGPCYTTEYAVGPLPICKSTTAVPLHWLNGGNATREAADCSWDDDDGEWGPQPTPVPGNGTRSSSLPFTPPGAPAREHPADGAPRGQRPDDRKRRRDLRSNRIQRRDPTNPYEEVMEWDGTKLAHDEKAAPVTILPDGARHEFDPKQNFVSWMDFTFYIATGPGGISLHDVQFKGERVVYELAMQEALAHYAGPNESQNEASYLDVSIGYTRYNLIPGFDCPAYATYTDAFCLFEFPKDYPMSRHGEWMFYHATRNVAFMLRSVSTVGNYDYQTTYEFHYDGTIQVIVRATGYIQSDLDVESEDWNEYGFRIREDMSGSMHDHVLNFKADLDVKGTKNSLMKTEFVPNSQVYDWSEGQVYNNMKAERSFVSNEAKINWAPNSAAAYSIVNKDEPNEFGEYPGFKIYPSVGSTIHLTVENSTVMGQNVQWASHQLYAVQRKDSEPNAVHPYTSHWQPIPRVSFNDFFDDESLDQEDLVVYFNLGMHHMPDTYDLPVTVFQGAQSGIALRPQNYHRSNNAIRTRHQIHITNRSGEQVVETNGIEDYSGSFDMSQANPQSLPMPEDMDFEWEDPDWDEEDGDDGSSEE